MRNTRVALGCCLAAFAIFAVAQSVKKPGLWEITSTTAWKQSPLPPGVEAPPGSKSIFNGEPHVSNVCLTQEMIDQYGAPMPQSRDCQVQNLVKTATSMKADWVCSGKMEGKGTLESTETDEGKATGTVHFTGTMLMGEEKRPAEFTIQTTSVFKNSDCGDVKPLPMPQKPQAKD